MNEKSRFFPFKWAAWIYYWRLRLQGYTPTTPYRMETLLWGDVWCVDWPPLRKAA